MHILLFIDKYYFICIKYSFLMNKTYRQMSHTTSIVAGHFFSSFFFSVNFDVHCFLAHCCDEQLHSSCTLILNSFLKTLFVFYRAYSFGFKASSSHSHFNHSITDLSIVLWFLSSST